MSFNFSKRIDKIRETPDGRLRVQIDDQEYVKTKDEWTRMCKRILFNCGFEFDMSTATITKLEPML